MWPDEPRSTRTLQRNEPFGADSRRMTTSTERILNSCCAIDVKTRYSAYARLSGVSDMFTPETLIRIAFNEGKWRAVRND